MNVSSAFRLPAGDAKFSINAQDSTVMASSVLTLHGVNPDVSTDKVSLLGGLTPNSNGNYVYDDLDPNFTASNAFAAVANAAALAERVSGEPIVWATGRPKLTVTPNAGQDFNAFYSREDGGVFFYHGTDPVTKEVIFSGNSSEVTGHECWHAILDAKRPAYLSSFAPEPGAFHEAMGDVGALLTTLHNPDVVDLIVKQTKGDLSKQNAAAALGEQMGVAINHLVGDDVTGGPWTRNALNNFTWKDPASLPPDAPPDQLSSEVHSLSRLWTGAIYDVLSAVVKENMAQGQDARGAITQAADDLLKVQFRLLAKDQAPEASFTFRDMARALVKSENELNGGKFTGIIEKVMDQRKILPHGAAFLEVAGVRQVSTVLSGDQFGQFNGARVSQTVSGSSLGFVESDRADLERDLARLIQAGDIKMTDPHEDPSKVSLFKPNGSPYKGVVRWESGQPVIEPTHIAA